MTRLLLCPLADAYLSRQEKLERARAKTALKEFDKEIVAQYDHLHQRWLEFLAVCKQVGLVGPFFKNKPPDFPQNFQATDDTDLATLRKDFQNTKSLFLDARNSVEGLRTKQEGLRDLCITPPIFVSIHERAK